VKEIENTVARHLLRAVSCVLSRYTHRNSSGISHLKKQKKGGKDTEQ
jgi:hypothetical protein